MHSAEIIPFIGPEPKANPSFLVRAKETWVERHQPLANKVVLDHGPDLTSRNNHQIFLEQLRIKAKDQAKAPDLENALFITDSQPKTFQ